MIYILLHLNIVSMAEKPTVHVHCTSHSNIHEHLTFVIKMALYVVGKRAEMTWVEREEGGGK